MNHFYQWCMDRITKPANITTHFLSVLLEKKPQTINLFFKDYYNVTFDSFSYFLLQNFSDLDVHIISIIITK